MLEVAGFRYYANELTHPLEIGCRVELLPEPQNAKDAGAVEIRAHDQRIGYVNRLQAPTFLSALMDLAITHALSFSFEFALLRSTKRWLEPIAQQRYGAVRTSDIKKQKRPVATSALGPFRRV
jgi:hypothetical protein